MIRLELLLTPRTLVRLIDATDAGRLLEYRVTNRDHLAPWEPVREGRHFTLEGCAQDIGTAMAMAQDDRAYAFAVLDPAGERMLGSVTLSNVARGIFQACHLGYGLDAASVGQGLMEESLHGVLDCAFGPLALHRVMANYMPRNERSARLLTRLDFQREGLARQYLKIAGRWEDHVLTARLAPG